MVCTTWHESVATPRACVHKFNVAWSGGTSGGQPTILWFIEKRGGRVLPFQARILAIQGPIRVAALSHKAFNVVTNATKFRSPGILGRAPLLPSLLGVTRGTQIVWSFNFGLEEFMVQPRKWPK